MLRRQELQKREVCCVEFTKLQRFIFGRKRVEMLVEKGGEC